MNLINTLESLSEKDAEQIGIFTKEYDLLLKGSKEWIKWKKNWATIYMN